MDLLPSREEEYEPDWGCCLGKVGRTIFRMLVLALSYGDTLPHLLLPLKHRQAIRRVCGVDLVRRETRLAPSLTPIHNLRGAPAPWITEVNKIQCTA